MKTLKFERNQTGRDFVVPDLHGCFDRLMAVLKEIAFDKTRDRVFCLGDLVDRGRQNIECVGLLCEPWFHSVRGNHEEMLIDYYEGRVDAGLYSLNGGDWFIRRTDPAMQKWIVDTLSELPYAIEIETTHGLVGLIHANIEGNSWHRFVGKEDRRSKAYALWNRDLGEKWVKDVCMVYTGHNIVGQPIKSGNVIHMDLGCFQSGKLACFSLE